MKMSFSGSYVNGTVSPPSSKSHTHRAFMLASMADGTSTISSPLLSDDTMSTLRAMKALGSSVEMNGDSVKISGGRLREPGATIDAGNSGTTIRLLTGIASAFDGTTKITGDESLQKRPMSPLLDSLKTIGAECTSNKGFPPISVKGPIKSGAVHIKGDMSSQFVSSLMIAGPLTENGLKIHVDGKLVSRPYVDITSHMMRLFGADASIDSDTIAVGGSYRPFDYKIPADFSSAAFPLVAGAVAGKVSVKGMDLNDPQGDKRIVDILKKAGAKIAINGDEIVCEKKELIAADIDIDEVPDLFPILAVLFSTAEGTTRLYGAPQLRFKESDRIATVTEMLRAIGADINATDDGCVIRGVKRLVGGHVDDRGDHRIAMAAAVASLLCDNPVTVENAECCSVSYPDFLQQMRSLGMEVI